MTGSAIKNQGFTLIELAIVLVIIGVLAAGVLVGQSLIRATAVSATITQVEKYNQAVNTFREKYGGLPGDLDAADAAQFGFAPRGSQPGEGDGNGVIEGNNWSVSGPNSGIDECAGETSVFWVDLSQAHLIDGGFNTASETSAPSFDPTLTTTPSIDAYFPQAKLGRGNYIYVFSYGGVNYYGIAQVTQIWSEGLTAAPSLTVSEAYSIDTKVDEGLPTTGKVTALILFGYGNNLYYANTGDYQHIYTGSPDTAQINPHPYTCYDWYTTGVQETYTMSQNNGAGVNCALVFQFE